MSFIAFPLRLSDAFLRRCEEPEAVLALIRVMAITPHGSWAGSKHFGLRDLFEQGRNRPELPQLAVQEINRALEDLGITHYKVQTIAAESPSKPDVDSYVVTLVSTGPGGETYSVNI